MDDEGTSGAGRPLTRRELRALEAAARDDQSVDEGAPEAEPGAPAAGEPAWPVAESTLSQTTWSDDVRWSLHGELPRELPPEPDVDDVRWEPDVADTIPAPAVARLRWAEDTPDLLAPSPDLPRPPAGVPDDYVDQPTQEWVPGWATEEEVPAQGRSAPTRVSAWQLAAEDTLGSPLPPAPVPPPVAEQWDVPSASEQLAEEQVVDELLDADQADAHLDADLHAGLHAEQLDEAHAGPWYVSAPPPPPATDESLTDAPAPDWPFPAVPVDEPQGAIEPEDVGAAGPGPGGYGPPPVSQPEELPTLSDLLAARPTPPAGPAELGWRGTLRRVTGGLLALRPGPAEQQHRAAVAAVQRTLDGPRSIVVINPKGGAHKTTASLLLAATFGQHRGGYTLAWDNNETRGTLGWRAAQAGHHRTAVDLLQDLDRFADLGHARVGDLDNYVRSQGAAQFDVLASDEDAASAGSIDDFAFRRLHRTLARFYRIMVIDTGNNMRASNWQAAIETADQVVIVSTVREDTAQSAAWAIDALRANGYEDAVRKAVTVLSDPAPRRDTELSARLHDHFGRLTRAVIDVPHDRSLVGGTPLEWERLDLRTREAWLRVAAVVAEGL